MRVPVAANEFRRIKTEAKAFRLFLEAAQRRQSFDLFRLPLQSFFRDAFGRKPCLTKRVDDLGVGPDGVGDFAHFCAIVGGRTPVKQGAPFG